MVLLLLLLSCRDVSSGWAVADTDARGRLLVFSFWMSAGRPVKAARRGAVELSHGAGPVMCMCMCERMCVCMCANKMLMLMLLLLL